MKRSRRGRAARTRRPLAAALPFALAFGLVAVAGYAWWQRLPTVEPGAVTPPAVALVADRNAKGLPSAPVVIEEWGDFG